MKCAEPGGGTGKFGEFPYGGVDGMHVNVLCEPVYGDWTIVAADGERVCIAVELLCSDFIESGVCDFIE